MKGTYRCTNVKFCMEDENQCRAWEYLHSLSRKDGSYGKVLSDALVVVLDGGFQPKSKQETGSDKTFEKGFETPIRELAEETARIVLTGIKTMAGEGLSLQNVEMAQQATEVLEQKHEEDIAEDMLSFAFGMDE
ncbi:hypothetical protein [Hespellia stercorisuis]|uniref:Uncharacterized protein n=1 Tax=Hespellia stercorisuis DSM 15480 TaxID=1121950 RepID=A0A1M6VR69_9FIRM|nr:hypothetical protein [Hespellia stercorisuis]SHK84032.1 hypothetical protein SAMN02745243_03838 [Hespellia stercorisuis DSM 15480]